jgi:hypothetical protein
MSPTIPSRMLSSAEWGALSSQASGAPSSTIFSLTSCSRAEHYSIVLLSHPGALKAAVSSPLARLQIPLGLTGQLP